MRKGLNCPPNSGQLIVLKELKGKKDSFPICIPKPESDAQAHVGRRDSTPKKYFLAHTYATFPLHTHTK